MVTCAGRQPACSMGKQSVDFSVLASGRGLTKCGNDAVLFSKRHRHFFGGGAKSSSPFFFGRFFCFLFFGCLRQNPRQIFFGRRLFFFGRRLFGFGFALFTKKLFAFLFFGVLFFLARLTTSLTVCVGSIPPGHKARNLNSHARSLGEGKSCDCCRMGCREREEPDAQGENTHAQGDRAHSNPTTTRALGLGAEVFAGNFCKKKKADLGMDFWPTN